LLSGVVIAGGKSSRMGRDKALLPFREYSSLAKFQYKKLEDIFDRVYLSAKSDKFDFKANIIYDKYKDSNPLNAIISALEVTKTDIFLISVDIPLISKESIKRLIEAYNNLDYDIYIAKSSNGLEPTVAIYRYRVLDRAKQMYSNGNFRLMSLVKNSNYLAVEFNNLDEFINVNTPSEYEKILTFKTE